MDKRWIVYLPSFFSGIYISVDTMRCFFSCRGRRWSAECCWNKLLMLLVFIFFCREQCWRSGIVVSVVVYINYPAGGSKRSRDVLFLGTSYYFVPFSKKFVVIACVCVFFVVSSRAPTLPRQSHLVATFAKCGKYSCTLVVYQKISSAYTLRLTYTLACELNSHRAASQTQ